MNPLRRLVIIFVFLFLLTLSLSANLKQEKELTQEDNEEIQKFASKFLFESLSPLSNFMLEKAPSEKTCGYCKTAVVQIKDFVVEKHGFTGLYKFLTYLCSIGLDEDVCSKAISGYAPVFFKNFIDNLFDEQHLCAKINLCQEGNKFIDQDEYAKELLKSKPQKKREPIDTKAKKWRMLQVTDAHYDLYYKEGAAVDCNKPLCCRDPPSPTSFSKKARKFGYPGKCDINEHVFRSFLDAAEQAHPDFIVWTGDNAPHDIWMGSQQHVFESTKVLRDMLNEKFQHKIPIYPILGNHEKYPNDEYGKEEKELLAGMADLYKEYLDEEAYKQFKETGYYSMMHPNSNLRIIALNCMECDTFNFNLISDQTGTQKMFMWLENELLKAEKNGEFVYILDHIPINASFYLTQCALRLRALIDRFNYIIRGHFSGHTHLDDIVGVHSYFNVTDIISINYVAPALTTFSHKFPSFRVFEIDSNTKQVIDYEQYRLNVTDANIKGVAKWNLSHKATEFFKVKDLTEMKKMTEIDPEGDYIVKRFSDTEKAKKKSHKSSSIREAKCTIQNDNFNDYRVCAHPKFGIDVNWLFQILNNLCGKWKVLN